ncbi:hypothetical protein ACLI4Z_01780 [Natrialbaceae archaeon A-arb3/5]
MAARADGARRFLAVAAIICAVCGLVLAASAMPLLASDSPTSGISEGASSGTTTGESASSMEPAASQSGSDGAAGGIDGGGETESGDQLPGDGSSLAGDRASSGVAETVAGGALYGLGTVFSMFDDDSNGGETTSDAAGDGTLDEAVAGEDDAAAAASDSDVSGMGGEFGSMLSGDDGPNAAGDGTFDEDGAGEDVSASDGDPDVSNADDPAIADGNGDQESLIGDGGSDAPIEDNEFDVSDGDGSVSSAEDESDSPADGETDPADEFDADEQGPSSGLDEEGVSTDGDRDETDGDGEFDADVDDEERDADTSEGEHDDADWADGDDERGGDELTDESSETTLDDGSQLEDGTNGNEDDVSASETTGEEFDSAADEAVGDGIDERADGGDEAAGVEIGDDHSTDASAAESDASEAAQSGETEDDAGGGGESGQNGESTLDDGLFDLSGTAIAAVLGAIALLVAGYVLYTRDDPIGALRSLPGRLHALVLSGVVACSQALERTVAALRGLGSITELPALVLATLARFLDRVRTRTQTARSSFEAGGGEFAAGEAGGGDTVTDRERIRNAFESVIDASTMYRAQVANATPADVAGSAKRAGAPDEPVETITASFRDVEYGNRDPRPYLDPTESAHERLQAALAPTDPDADGEWATDGGVDGPVEAAE